MHCACVSSVQLYVISFHVRRNLQRLLWVCISGLSVLQNTLLRVVLSMYCIYAVTVFVLRSNDYQTCYNVLVSNGVLLVNGRMFS